MKIKVHNNETEKFTLNERKDMKFNRYVTLQLIYTIYVLKLILDI